MGDNEIEFIGDSGASATFTYSLDDFIEYQKLDRSLEARTANKGVPLKILGKGTVLLHHKVEKGKSVIIWLNPVYYIPGLSIRLLSIGEWLQQGCILRGTKHRLAILQDSQNRLSLYPKKAPGTIYWFLTTLLKEQTNLAQLSTIFAVDYDLWHCRMGHPSKDVLSQAQRHIENFLKDLASPRVDAPICRGCAEGKMHLQPFEDSTS